MSSPYVRPIHAQTDETNGGYTEKRGLAGEPPHRTSRVTSPLRRFQNIGSLFGKVLKYGRTKLSSQSPSPTTPPSASSTPAFTNSGRWVCAHGWAKETIRATPTTCFETFPFPEHLTPRDTADKGQCAPDTQADSAAKAISEAAFKLNQLRENWLNPPEWVDWVITPEEEKAGYPKRPVAKPGYEADLKKRTLTNLYNARPAWLDMAHKNLDKAVAAAYGWVDYTPDISDEVILHRLLAINLERSKAVEERF